MNLPGKRKKRAADKNKKNTSSSTFLKDPLESIVVHIGKILDNATPSQITDVGLNLALGYMGYQAFKTPEGALLGPIALKLATSQNLAGSIAGVAGLTMLGLCWVNPAGEGEPDSTGMAGNPPPDMSPKPADPVTGLCPPNHTAIWSDRTGRCMCIHNNLVTPFSTPCSDPFIPSPPEPPYIPPVDGGNDGGGPPLPPPPPPPTGWTYDPVQPGGWRCATCNVCGAQECAWTAGTLADAIASHMTVHQGGGGGGGIE